MTDSEIKSNLKKAIVKLYDNDSYLIEQQAHERSITHMLAVHLRSFFLDYDIDCEYDVDITNLDGNFPKKKEIEALKFELQELKKQIEESPKHSINKNGDVIVPLNFLSRYNHTQKGH